MNSFKLPFLSELEAAQNVLIAGAGGGFDVFSGLPLYFSLASAGKNVFLANLTFSNLPPATAGRAITPVLTEVTAKSEGSESYFPEKHLADWFAAQGNTVSIYCFHRVGPKPIADSYRELVAMHEIDTVILVDGGTDSLMRGDEDGLGTPCEESSRSRGGFFISTGCARSPATWNWRSTLNNSTMTCMGRGASIAICQSEYM